MAEVKIAVIGGGSAYCPVFLSAMANLAESFRGSELVLMDIDARNLEIICRLGKRLFDAAAAGIEIRQTMDRKDAIAGADFVLTTFRPGGYKARVFDEKIPMKYGIIGQETVGPGGFLMALRSVAVLKGIVSEMEALAPRAFLLNYTNPTNIVTEAVSTHSSIRVIGLCDQQAGDKRRIADALDVESSRLQYQACGLNHATWSTLFTLDGKEGMPRLLDQAPAVLADAHTPEPVKRMFRLALCYGCIPNRYLQYYYFREDTFREAEAAPLCRAEQVMAEIPGYFEHYEAESKKRKPHLTKMRGGSRAFGDFAVEIIKAIACDEGSLNVLNVPNRGALPDFEPDRVVETACIVDRRGALPQAQGALPRTTIGLLRMLSEFQALTAKAAWEGSRADGLRALIANPLVLSLPRAAALYDELAAAHAQFLPERLVVHQ